MSAINCSLGRWPVFSVIRTIERNRIVISPKVQAQSATGDIPCRLRLWSDDEWGMEKSTANPPWRTGVLALRRPAAPQNAARLQDPALRLPLGAIARRRNRCR